MNTREVFNSEALECSSIERRGDCTRFVAVSFQDYFLIAVFCNPCTALLPLILFDFENSLRVDSDGFYSTVLEYTLKL